MPALVAVLLTSLSVVMFSHAFRNYWSTKQLLQPNIQALSPAPMSRSVETEVLPILPPTPAGELARTVLKNHVSGAAGLHELLVTQADAQVKLAAVHSCAWLSVLAISLFLVARLWRPRPSDA